MLFKCVVGIAFGLGLVLAESSRAGVCGGRSSCPCPCGIVEPLDNVGDSHIAPGFSMGVASVAEFGPGDCDNDGDVPSSDANTNGTATFEFCNITGDFLANITLHFPTTRYVTATVVVAGGGSGTAEAEITATANGVPLIPETAVDVSNGTETINTVSTLGALTFDLQPAGQAGDCFTYTLFTSANASAEAIAEDICLGPFSCESPVCETGFARAHAIARVHVRWRGILVSFDPGGFRSGPPIPYEELTDTFSLRNVSLGFLPRISDLDTDHDVDYQDFENLQFCLMGPTFHEPFLSDLNPDGSIPNGCFQPPSNAECIDFHEASATCWLADVNQDNFIDLKDFAQVQREFAPGGY